MDPAFFTVRTPRAHTSAAAGMHTVHASMNEPASMNRDACMLLLLLLAAGC
jgi:hypothetical protein